MPVGPAGIGGRVEGLHAVAAALAAGRVRSLTVEEGRSRRSPLADMIAAHPGVAVTVVDDVRPLAVTTAPQGVVADCRPIASLDLASLVGAEEVPAILAIDHVEDPHNLGAMARTAMAAGVRSLVVPDRRGAPLDAAAFKAAAGALEHARIAVVSSIAEAVVRLGKLGVWSVGLDAAGDRELFGLDLLTQPVVIVVGGETGLHRLVRDRVDVVASIPMAGTAESLNASVAASLACYELFRLRRG